MDLLYISRSSAVRPTLHSQVHHNVTTPFSQYLWSSSVSLALYFSFYSINFFNGWFRLHVRNNLFVFLIKFPSWLRLWIGLLYVLSMILKIFHDIIYFQMHLCVSPCFCSGSTFHVHVAVDNTHVHNALLNFVICCLP